MDDEAQKKVDFYRAVIDRAMVTVQKENAFAQPTKLSSLIVKLAWANSMYGRYLSVAQVQYRTIRKDVFDEQIKNGASATRAKEEARNAALELEQKYDEMYNVHQDTKDFITVCMSYLKIMGIEVRLNNL